MLLLWFLFVSILILISISLYHRKELFAELPIVGTNNLLNLKMKEVSYRYYDINDWETTILKNKNLTDLSSLVCDPFEAEYYFKGLSTVPLEAGYFVSLMEPTKAFHTECSFQWDGKKVGVLDSSGSLFVKALAKGYRINVSIVQIPKSQWDRLDSLLAKNELDAIVVYFIPMSPMNRVLLGQKLSIMGFKDLDYARIQISYPFIQEKPIDLTYYFRGFTSYIMARERETVVPEMRLQQINLTETTEPFITRLETSSDRFDPTYHCYGDETLDIKGLCNSKYTTFGMPKTHSFTNWDAPCLRNEDCPFYKANKRYPNERGGCLALGMCEFPVGIKRVGFRKYSTEPPYQPICHGCISDPNCCQRQSSPDYAFPNDSNPRQQAGIALQQI